MNELDLLKTHWQKDEEHIKFKKEDIISMIHKSSSSIVKWIFIICCLEFIFGLALSFFYSSEEKESKLTQLVINISDVLFYIIIIYFIYRFYILFKQITNYRDTKALLQVIKDVRENADRYIKFNLLVMSIFFIAGGFYTLVEKYNEKQSWGEQIFYGIAFGILMTLVWLLFRKILKLYYKLLYGILLKKLNKNYEELIELDK